MTKPMLACDWNEAKVSFPVAMQPKIDGVRGLNLNGLMTGRSLKCHANKHITSLFSLRPFIGFDGELAAAGSTDAALCRATTSATNTIEGAPFVLWWVFDYITPMTIGLPYYQRYEEMERAIASIAVLTPHLSKHIRAVPMTVVANMEQLLELDTQWLAQGFEGSILRELNGAYKQGRSTVREGGLLRIKRFEEEEATVVSVVEGSQNNNEATINELGNTERSTHKENMSPNGMVGALTCIDTKTGALITVAAGRMTHDERVKYFQNQSLIVGQIIKYKTFKKGVKDKPRFPTFQVIKAPSDIGPAE